MIRGSLFRVFRVFRGPPLSVAAEGRAVSLFLKDNELVPAMPDRYSAGFAGMFTNAADLLFPFLGRPFRRGGNPGRPFRAWSFFIARTQGVARGWLVTGPSALQWPRVLMGLSASLKLRLGFPRHGPEGYENGLNRKVLQER